MYFVFIPSSHHPSLAGGRYVFRHHRTQTGREEQEGLGQADIVDGKSTAGKTAATNSDNIKMRLSISHPSLLAAL